MTKAARRVATIGAITYLVAVAGAPASAQTARSSLTAVHVYVADDVVSDELTLPANLEVAFEYGVLVPSMLRRSATFRRQCLRLANEPRLRVHLQSAPPFWTLGARAVTRIVRQAGILVDATIYIGERQHGVELIAHEVEHVIEQLDQIDLPSRAALPDSGVHQVGSEGLMFETTRAMRVGLKVAREVFAADRRSD